jgi:hypothetical protein
MAELDEDSRDLQKRVYDEYSIVWTDADALQKQVYDFARKGRLGALRALLNEHPDVDVDGYKDNDGRNSLWWTCVICLSKCARLLLEHNVDVNAKDSGGSTPLQAAASGEALICVKLLVQNGADVNCQTFLGSTPLITSAANGRKLTIPQYLLDHKADIHYRISEGMLQNQDALHGAMRSTRSDFEFAFLSCNTDAKKVKTDAENAFITPTKRDAHVETFKHVQAYIDEYHDILTNVLSEHVQVDTRVGRGDNGIYQEPLERTLEYLGLSMSKDQVVNTSIDGDEVKRALIPGHLINANHWFNKYKSRSRLSLTP